MSLLTMFYNNTAMVQRKATNMDQYYTRLSLDNHISSTHKSSTTWNDTPSKPIDCYVRRPLLYIHSKQDVTYILHFKAIRYFLFLVTQLCFIPLRCTKTPKLIVTENLSS